MQRFEEPVQNLRGDVLTLCTMLVMVAGTNTPATVFSDAAGTAPVTDLRTDKTGIFSFYAPNGRYDVYAVINGVRVGHKIDLLMYDPTDDTTGPALAAIRSKLGETVSVKDFGAKGDGTTDDTAAFQSALTAQAGSVLMIPPGTYIVGALTVPANSEVIGQGNRSIIKRKAGASAGPILMATNGNRITIANLALDGNRSACTGGDANLYFTGCYDVEIENVRAGNSLTHGISVHNSQDTTNNTVSIIRNCNVVNAAQYGIEAQDANRIIITGNRVEQSGSYGIIAYGTVAYSFQNVTIEDNTVIKAGGSGIAVPFVSGGTATTPGVEEVVMSGNSVESSALNGYVVQARFASVVGNTASRNGTTMNHQGFVINVLSVTMTGNTSTRNAGVGIDFGDCKRVVASGNVVEENGIIGIEINSTEDFTVTGNVVVNNNQTNGAGVLGAGILAHLGTGGYTFAGNTMNGVIANNIVRSGPNQQFGIKATADTSNLRIMNNDALAAGSVRDYEILTPSGQFIQTGNTIAAPTLTPADSVTIPQVGSFFYVNAGATTINSIVTDGGTYEFNREITLKFNGAATVASGAGNIYLNGSTMSATNGSLLVLVRADATGWIEKARRA